MSNTAKDKYQMVKRLLLRQMGIAAVIIAVCAGGAYFLSYTEGVLTQDLMRLRNDILTQQQRLQTIIQQKKNYKESLLLWEKLTQKSKELKGIRIDDGQQELEVLRNRYHISNLESNFTVPEKSTDKLLTTDNIIVMTSTVTLNFEAISDEYAFAFVNAITNSLPGYTRITSMQINKIGDLTDTAVAAARNGNFPRLVKGSVRLLWQDLKSVEAAKPAAPAEGADTSFENDMKQGRG